MPFKDPAKRLEYQRKWIENNKEKKQEYDRKRFVNKRCPACRKNITVNSHNKVMVCPHCGVRIQVSNVFTANKSSGNINGVRLWVPVCQRYKK